MGERRPPERRRLTAKELKDMKGRAGLRDALFLRVFLRVEEGPGGPQAGGGGRRRGGGREEKRGGEGSERGERESMRPTMSRYYYATTI
jgi:hypothetical protein